MIEGEKEAAEAEWMDSVITSHDLNEIDKI